MPVTSFNVKPSARYISFNYKAATIQRQPHDTKRCGTTEGVFNWAGITVEIGSEIELVSTENPVYFLRRNVDISYDKQQLAKVHKGHTRGLYQLLSHLC